MSEGPQDEHKTTRKVREFYEQFRFPGVRPWDRDGIILMRRIRNFISGGGSPIRALDAGCGTGNTAVSLARSFPQLELLGVDISSPSLLIAQESAKGLTNLRLRIWDLMEALLDEGPFHIILCLGVLHHTANMHRVLWNLGAMLKDEGELYLWVYGRHGRYRHSLNRRLLGILLNAAGDEMEAVHLATEFAFKAGNGIMLADLLGGWGDESKYKTALEEPAWIADQFLHPNENVLDMEDILAMISRAGLRLEKWLGIPEEITRHIGSAELAKRFAVLPEKERLLATDLFLKPDHYFLLLRK